MVVVADTIFYPAFGNRPSCFVGRENILERLLEGLRSKPGSKDRAVMVLGQRGSGKTVLLWELAERARKEGFVVASPTVASEGMLERIVEKIQDDGEAHVRQRTVHVSGGSVGALGFSAGLQFSRDVQESKSFQYKLSHLCRKLGEQQKGVLILVDELQASSPEIRQLVIAYQELVGERQNIALVMAGLPGAVSATLNDRVLTFLNRARKLELEPLGFAEVDAFFAQSFKKLGLRVPDSLRMRASRATFGSPYMLQLVGHSVVLYAAEDGTVGEGDLLNALAMAQCDFENDVCGTTIAALSEKDGEFLLAMSQDDGVSGIADVARRMGVSYDYAQKYRKRLIDAGIVEVPARGKVAFAVPYLAEYLRREV